MNEKSGVLVLAVFLGFCSGSISVDKQNQKAEAWAACENQIWMLNTFLRRSSAESRWPRPIVAYTKAGAIEIVQEKESHLVLSYQFIGNYCKEN